MANVIDQWTITTDRLLDGLELEWSVAVRTITRWADMSDYEQMVFIEEWAIPRGYYQELQVRCEQGRLSENERRRFAVLRRMIDLHRPAVEAILEDSAI